METIFIIMMTSLSVAIIVMYGFAFHKVFILKKKNKRFLFKYKIRYKRWTKEVYESTLKILRLEKKLEDNCWLAAEAQEKQSKWKETAVNNNKVSIRQGEMISKLEKDAKECRLIAENRIKTEIALQDEIKELKKENSSLQTTIDIVKEELAKEIKELTEELYTVQFHFDMFVEKIREAQEECLLKVKKESRPKPEEIINEI